MMNKDEWDALSPEQQQAVLTESHRVVSDQVKDFGKVVEPPHPSYTFGRGADWSLVPERMIGGLRRYIEEGIPPGDFLTAVRSNDLRGSIERADDENAAIIFNYIRFLYCYAPSECWGSEKKFEDWIKMGGLNGRKK